MKQILIAVIGVAFSSNQAWACKLTPDSSWSWSDETLVSRTGLIVVAEVVGEEAAKDSVDPNNYNMKVLRAIKGSAEKPSITVEAYPKASEGDATYTKNCKLSTKLVKGMSYLVFVNGFHPKAYRPLDTSAPSKDWLVRVEQLAGGAISPEHGYVPNSDVAEKIAEAILVPIYGKKALEQKPFKISLDRDRWIVDGQLKSVPGQPTAGGVVHIEIKKSTGEILKVIHGK